VKTVGVVREQAAAEPSACSELPALAPEAAGEDRVGTRNRVARLILANGASTAADLAARLGLTPAGVRRHLDALLAENLIEAHEQRVYGHRGRGRPAKVFALTSEGRAVFHHAYDDMAIDALRFIEQTGGDEALGAFARRRFSGLADRYAATLAAADQADRPRLLAEALSADGYAASLRVPGSADRPAARAASGTAVSEPKAVSEAKPASGTKPVSGKNAGPGAKLALGEQLCQHHCPVQHVAERFPQLCEAETQVFAELLGTHVQRLATIAHGDGVCTTFIPAAAVTPSATPTAGRPAPTPAPSTSEGESAV
jgi:predicted ArsR family transcriptional regulator